MEGLHAKQLGCYNVSYRELQCLLHKHDICRRRCTVQCAIFTTIWRKNCYIKLGILSPTLISQILYLIFYNYNRELQCLLNKYAATQRNAVGYFP